MRGRGRKTKRANETKPSWNPLRQPHAGGTVGRIWVPWCWRSYLQAGRTWQPVSSRRQRVVFPTRFSRPCNQPPAAHPCLAGLGGHPGGSEGDQRCPKRLFKLFPIPPAAFPEAAVSRVNLEQFKESLSGARRMMNVETITGEAPWSCLKLSSPM